jgi:hypothetical protein
MGRVRQGLAWFDGWLQRVLDWGLILVGLALVVLYLRLDEGTTLGWLLLLFGLLLIGSGFWFRHRRLRRWRKRP